MPRSSAAVLTLVSTPLAPESCVSCRSEEAAEVPADEGVSSACEGFGSRAIQSGSSRQGGARAPSPFPAPQSIGYHAQPPPRNPAIATATWREPPVLRGAGAPARAGLSSALKLLSNEALVALAIRQLSGSRSPSIFIRTQPPRRRKRGKVSTTREVLNSGQESFCAGRDSATDLRHL